MFTPHRPEPLTSIASQVKDLDNTRLGASTYPVLAVIEHHTLDGGSDARYAL